MTFDDLLKFLGPNEAITIKHKVEPLCESYEITLIHDSEYRKCRKYYTYTITVEEYNYLVEALKDAVITHILGRLRLGLEGNHE